VRVLFSHPVMTLKTGTWLYLQELCWHASSSRIARCSVSRAS